MFRSSQEDEDEGIPISGKMFTFLILGIVLVFIGIAVIVVASLVLGGSSSSSVVILIGQIPIVFGSGPNALWLILVGVVLTILSVALFWFINRRSRKFSYRE